MTDSTSPIQSVRVELAREADSPALRGLLSFFSPVRLYEEFKALSYSPADDIRALVSIVQDEAAKTSDRIAAVRQLRAIRTEVLKAAGQLADVSKKRHTDGPDGPADERIAMTGVVNQMRSVMPLDTEDTKGLDDGQPECESGPRPTGDQSESAAPVDAAGGQGVCSDPTGQGGSPGGRGLAGDG